MRPAGLLLLAGCAAGELRAPVPRVADVSVAQRARGADPDLSLNDRLTASDAQGGDAFGWSVAGAGDLDADGYDDVAVGARGDDDAVRDGGAVYVYTGDGDGLDPGGEQKILAAGLEIHDAFGWVVARAGDVNGDGSDDLLVGSKLDDDVGENGGAAWIYTGGASGLDETSEAKITASDGAAGAFFGTMLSGAGDLDGDGLDDLIVGASAHRRAGAPGGAAYVYPGGDAGLGTEEQINPPDGALGDEFGRGVSGAGDLDGDGYADAVVGSPNHSGAASNAGAAYVFMGSATGLDLSRTQKLTSSDAAPTDYFGSSVAGLGDVDGDGHDDLVTGAHCDDDMGTASGSAYVFYGSTAGVDTAREDKLTASDGQAYDYLGRPVAAAGDLDADGYRDLILGAHMDDDLGSNAGAAYVFYGSNAGIDASTERKITPSDLSADDEFGWSVASAGDIDADGRDDLVIGAAGADVAGAHIAGAESGAIYVYTSPPDLDEDGVDANSDCDDADASVGAGTTEIVDNGVDDDCDGYEACYADADLDGYRGNLELRSEDLDCADATEAGGGVPGGDCNDADADVHPGATEIAGDGVDQDCDDLERCYADADFDGYAGTAEVTTADMGCLAKGNARAYEAGQDCDDADAAVYPGAVERTGDEVDGDCDGAERCYVDADADGYRIADTVLSPDASCADAGEASALVPVRDCDDADAATHPGATEVVADGVDQDCDGAERCYSARDADGDGFVRGEVVASADLDCLDADESGSPLGEDCEDRAADIYPGAPETVGDGVDGDCDGAELCFADADEDGFSAADGGAVASEDLDCGGPGEASEAEPAGDCDDADATVYPGASEVADGQDNDCDGHDDTWDADGDGLSNLDEAGLGTDPLRTDTDGDGLNDGEETSTYGTDPLDEDSDDDGLSDGREVNRWGSSPTDVDSDDDGLDDRSEAAFGTDPNVADTDGGGVGDLEELEAHGDPLNPRDDGGEKTTETGCAAGGPAAAWPQALLLALTLRRRRARVTGRSA